MLFLMQDCSFDSLGISSVAVYLVDTGTAKLDPPRSVVFLLKAFSSVLGG